MNAKERRIAAAKAGLKQALADLATLTNDHHRAIPSGRLTKGTAMSEESKNGQNQWMELQGRLFAMETMISHLVWRWALDQEHPPTALATYLRPLEEKAAAMAGDPENDQAAMQAAVETIRGIGESLEHALHEEALRRQRRKVRPTHKNEPPVIGKSNDVAHAFSSGSLFP